MRCLASPTTLHRLFESSACGTKGSTGDCWSNTDPKGRRPPLAAAVGTTAGSSVDGLLLLPPLPVVVERVVVERVVVERRNLGGDDPN